MNAQDYRKLAADAKLEEAASFDRCDTDGFLSQWAHGIMAQRYNLEAELLDAGGKIEFLGLFTLDGKRVAAKLIDGKYGLCWMLLDNQGRSTGKFVKAFGSESALAKKGLKEVMELAPARVAIDQGGRGYYERLDAGYPKNDPELVYLGAL